MAAPASPIFRDNFAGHTLDFLFDDVFGFVLSPIIEGPAPGFFTNEVFSPRQRRELREEAVLGTVSLGVGKLVTGAKIASGGLKSAAKQIREAGTHPASRNQRVIAVGEDANGNIFAGSSGGFDKGQRAAADALGVQRVPTRAGRHAEENLLDAVPDLQRVGTDALDPCPRCLPQLIERGVKID